MYTAIILIIISILWWRANNRYLASGAKNDRRARAQWIWAFIGAGIGSFSGVAAMGSAIAGTLPGGIIGYMAAGYMMLNRQVGCTTNASSQIASATSDGIALAAIAVNRAKDIAQENMGMFAIFIRKTFHWMLWISIALICITIALSLFKDENSQQFSQRP
jgi:hypothetical protein